MNYLKQSLNGFQMQSSLRKTSLIIAILLITSLTIGLIYWALIPGYGVLFNHLDSRDANQILSQLDQEGISYQIRQHGSEILIDKQLIDKTRIKLMGSKLSLTHSVGFELFDKTDFGMTDFSQKINYQRALQGELERTINSLDEVKQARVHLVIPEHHLFEQENNLPRVAVTLHLYHALSAQQVRSIQQLLSASVANLPIKNVVIVDQNGNNLTTIEDDASSAHFASKKLVERYLNEKVMQMLSRIFNEEGFMVKIDATLNYDELQRELIKPHNDGLITHEKVTQHSTSSNKTDKKPTNKDFTREKIYELGREKERFTRANGTIERLTISVIVPRTTAKEKINQIERLVKSTVGFNPARGDTISVEALIVATQNEVIHPETIPMKPYVSKPIIYSGTAGFTLLLLITSGLFLHHRRKKRQYLLKKLNDWLIEHA